jgi:hypothetical protein
MFARVVSTSRRNLRFFLNRGKKTILQDDTVVLMREVDVFGLDFLAILK